LRLTDDWVALTNIKPILDEAEQTVSQESERPDQYERALERLTKKSMKVLRLICETGNPSTVLASNINQQDLARKLHITRQALSVHIARLSEAGLIQVGRGFINVTENGLKATGYHNNPVILTVRVAPRHQLQAYEKIKRIHASEIFRVSGDADFALILERSELDKVVQDIYAIEGVVDTKSLIATEVAR
jgi:DNA-binding MarR family transcriptional regulator